MKIISLTRQLRNGLDGVAATPASRHRRSPTASGLCKGSKVFTALPFLSQRPVPRHHRAPRPHLEVFTPSKTSGPAASFHLPCVGAAVYSFTILCAAIRQKKLVAKESHKGFR
jgi:hypothetical protein